MPFSLFPLAMSLFDSLRKPFEPPYLHFTLLCLLYVLFVCYFLFKRLGLLFGQLRRKWNPPSPYDPRLMAYYRNAVTFWALFLLVGLVMLSLSFYLSRFQYLGEKVEPAGLATYRGNTVQFVDVDGVEMTVTIKGEQAAAAGVFLRFPDWMGFLGLRTYHRLVTFRGNAQSEYHYGERPDAVWLRSFLDDPIYLFLYKNRNWLKIADPFYTESVYFINGKHRIHVTHSGYIIQ